MAFKHTTSKGVDLFLNSRIQIAPKSGKETTHYYFSKVVKNGVDEVPAGKVIKESGGLVFLANAEKAAPAPEVAAPAAA